MFSFRFHSTNHEIWVERLFQRVTDYYGPENFSLVVFGSWARGENKKSSDLDLLVVSDRLTGTSRFNRHRDFVTHIEKPCDDVGLICYHDGIATDVSCLLLSHSEARAFNPLYLDMSEHRAVIRDDGGFFDKVIRDVGEKMRRWGTRKFQVGGRWGWDIQPNATPGEVLRYDE